MSVVETILRYNRQNFDDEMRQLVEVIARKEEQIKEHRARCDELNTHISEIDRALRSNPLPPVMIDDGLPRGLSKTHK